MRRSLLLLVALLLLAPAPAAAEPLGALRFFAEPGPPPAAGPDPIRGSCVSSRAGDASVAAGPCTPASGLDGAEAVAVSPDGRHVYVASALADAVTVHGRDADSGALTPSGTAAGRALDGADGVAVSPDGARVYVTALVSDAVTAFARDATTGALTELGCVSEGGAGGGVAGRGLDHAAGVAVAADGRVLVAARRGDALAVLRPVATGLEPEGCLEDVVTSDTGAQGCTPARGLDGAYGVTVHGDTAYVASRVADAIALVRLGATVDQAGCVSQAPLADCAVLGRGLDGVTSTAVSPDGRNLYAAAYASYALTTFGRDGAGGLTLLGCRSEERETDRCEPGRALLYPHAVAVSPDGRTVYAASANSNALAIFHRTPERGDLVQESPAAGRTWSEGCLSWRGHRWSGATDLSASDHSDHLCARAMGLYYPSDLAIAADGRHVYASANRGDSVAGFVRLTEGTTAPSPAPLRPLPVAPAPPAPAPEPAAPAAPPAPAYPDPDVDRRAPRLRLVLPARISRRTLRTRGIAVTVRVGEPAALRLRLTTRTGGLLARRAVRLTRPGRVTLRLGPRAVRALRGRRAGPLRLSVTATDDAGNRAAAARRVTLGP